MTTSQKKAVQRHRERQAQRGLIRMEINVPEQDRQMLRSVAGELRRGGLLADRIRKLLASALEGKELVDFKKFLESAPLEGLELERSKDTGRDFEF